jgi:hypothetical protein
MIHHLQMREGALQLRISSAVRSHMFAGTKAASLCGDHLAEGHAVAD